MHPIVKRLLDVDAKLAKSRLGVFASPFPPLTPWWLDTFADFYESGKRQLVLRVGRRGGKSSSLSRLAVVEAVFGDHPIAAGDVGVVAVVSVHRQEASNRITLIKAILDRLKVKYRPCEGGIELVSKPIRFVVFTASIAGVSGFSSICILCDEVSKWKDADTGSNPAREVLASLRPTLAGQPNAKIFLSSSPMGRSDAHAKAFEDGSTDFQETASAQTWIARPTLTEKECHELEPDPDTFSREYGCVPFDGSTESFFTESALLAVTRRGVEADPPEHGVTYFAAQDPASRSNGWSLAIARSRDLGNDRHMVDVVGLEEWRAQRGGALDSDATLGQIAIILRAYGITDLWTDQWSYDSLRALASRHGISLLQEPSTQSSKVQAFEGLRRRVADQTCSFPDDSLLRQDLTGVRKWISKNGAFSIELEKVNGRHCDHAASVALVVSKAAEDSETPNIYDALTRAREAGDLRHLGPAQWGPGRRW